MRGALRHFGTMAYGAPRPLVLSLVVSLMLVRTRCHR